MFFLTPPQKIKKLRKCLGMNQEDLSADGITRPFISLIESGKRSISYNTAKILAEKFNNRAKELGLSLEIDLYYLLRSDKEDAEIYCTEKLKNIKSTDDIDEIINIANEYKLQKILADTYLYIGDDYFKANNYLEAYVNYLKALNYYKCVNINDKEPYLYNRLGRCKVNQLEYLEALTYFSFANYYAVIQNDDNIKRMSTYNIALCNKKLGRIDTSLKYINIYLSCYNKEKDFAAYIYANIIKASCYEMQKSIDTSICILVDLLSEFDVTDDPLLGYVYNNLGELYLKKEDFDKSLDFFNKAQQIRLIKYNNNLYHTLIEKSSVYIKQKLYMQAISLLEEGLNLASLNNDMEYLTAGYIKLADIYVILKDNKKAENIYEILLNLIQKNSDDKCKGKIINIYIKLSCLYLEDNNHDKLKEALLILNDLSEN